MRLARRDCGRSAWRWKEERSNPRPLDVAEPRSVDLHAWVHLERNVTYLSTNVFALAITIGPDEEDRSISRLSFDVAGHDFLILYALS